MGWFDRFATCFDQLVALNNKVNLVLMVLTSMLMSVSFLSLKLKFDHVLIENPDNQCLPQSSTGRLVRRQPAAMTF